MKVYIGNFGSYDAKVYNITDEQANELGIRKTVHTILYTIVDEPLFMLSVLKYEILWMKANDQHEDE